MKNLYQTRALSAANSKGPPRTTPSISALRTEMSWFKPPDSGPYLRPRWHEKERARHTLVESSQWVAETAQRRRGTAHRGRNQRLGALEGELRQKQSPADVLSTESAFAASSTLTYIQFLLHKK